MPNGSYFRLPSFDIPRGVRTAEHLTVAVEPAWGRKVVCLFSFQIETSRSRRYQVMEFCEGRSDPLPGASEIPISSLDEQFPPHSEDLAALRQSLSECQACEENAQSVLSFDLDSSTLIEWIHRAIVPRNCTLPAIFAS